MIEKMPLLELDKLFPDGIALFIGMVSFEDRCFSILENLKTLPVHCLLFKNLASGAIAQKNLDHMIGLTIERNTVVDLDISSPITTADAFARALASEVIASSAGAIFIDTTTFTHEQLLILLRIIELRGIEHKIIMGYTGAETYSTNTDVEHVWLSRGVAQIRSVLGYPGRFSPSKRLHLIVVVGFEHERAAAVIEQFEPARLTLMCGDPEQSVSSSHYATNKRFFEKLQNFVERAKSTQTSVETCYISCVNPFEARDTVLKLASADEGYNVVVCPMNTKISTVGVGMAAIQNGQIQIAYARAIEYNENGYSTPSTMATVFEYPVAHRECINGVKAIKQPSVPSVEHDAGNLPA